MSWLSAGLEKVGISKSAQQGLTSLGSVALAPFTGGASLAVGAAMAAGASKGGQPSNAIEQGIYAAVQNSPTYAPTQQYYSATQGAMQQPATSFWSKWKVPILVGAGALALGGIAFIVIKKA